MLHRRQFLSLVVASIAVSMSCRSVTGYTRTGVSRSATEGQWHVDTTANAELNPSMPRTHTSLRMLQKRNAHAAEEIDSDSDDEHGTTQSIESYEDDLHPADDRISGTGQDEYETTQPIELYEDDLDSDVETISGDNGEEYETTLSIESYEDDLNSADERISGTSEDEYETTQSIELYEDDFDSNVQYSNEDRDQEHATTQFSDSYVNNLDPVVEEINGDSDDDYETTQDDLDSVVKYSNEERGEAHGMTQFSDSYVDNSDPVVEESNGDRDDEYETTESIESYEDDDETLSPQHDDRSNQAATLSPPTDLAEDLELAPHADSTPGPAYDTDSDLESDPLLDPDPDLDSDSDSDLIFDLDMDSDNDDFTASSEIDLSYNNIRTHRPDVLDSSDMSSDSSLSGSGLDSRDTIDPEHEPGLGSTANDEKEDRSAIPESTPKPKPKPTAEPEPHATLHPEKPELELDPEVPEPTHRPRPTVAPVTDPPISLEQPTVAPEDVPTVYPDRNDLDSSSSLTSTSRSKDSSGPNGVAPTPTGNAPVVAPDLSTVNGVSKKSDGKEEARTDSQSSHGNSGIAIGMVVLALAIAAIIVLVFVRRRQYLRTSSSTGSNDHTRNLATEARVPNSNSLQVPLGGAQSDMESMGPKSVRLDGNASLLSHRGTDFLVSMEWVMRSDPKLAHLAETEGQWVERKAAMSSLAAARRGGSSNCRGGARISYGRSQHQSSQSRMKDSEYPLPAPAPSTNAGGDSYRTEGPDQPITRERNDTVNSYHSDISFGSDGPVLDL